MRELQPRGASNRLIVALVGTLAVLALWNVVVRPSVASTYHLPGSLVVAVAVVALGLWAGLGAAGMGLARADFGSGLRWGAAAAGTVALVVLAGALLSATRASFDVPRAHVGLGELVDQVLVVIPLSTVLVEELIFRGTLLGLLLQLLPRAWAVAACSVLFGLWHLDVIVANNPDDALHVAAVGLGTVVATGTAGVVFCWLRLRSQSLLAPIFAHLATNTIPLVIAWFLVH